MKLFSRFASFFCFFIKTWKKKNSNFLLIHVKQLWDKEYANKYFINCVFQELFAAMYEKCFTRCFGSNGTRSWQYDKFGWHYSRLNWFYLAEFLWNEQIMGADATPGTFKVHLCPVRDIKNRILQFSNLKCCKMPLKSKHNAWNIF